MKSLRVLLSLVVVMSVLLATFLPAFAIGFVAEDVYESVFVVYSGNSLGSGFAIGENCIITNAHVIDNPDNVVIKSYSEKEYKAFVVGLDREQDIAVLIVTGAQFPYLVIADKSTMNTGDDVYAIGAPKSMSYTLTKGVISAKEREIGKYKYIQIDAPINEGNSGGPLLNDAGQVLGINTLKMSDSEGIGLAIPMDMVNAYLTTLGLGLNDAGNVSDNVTLPEPQEEPSEDGSIESTENQPYRQQDSALTRIALTVAVISVMGNIVLVILLVYQRKKNLNLKYDPRERTDFDIDILE